MSQKMVRECLIKLGVQSINPYQLHIGSTFSLMEKIETLCVHKKSQVSSVNHEFLYVLLL
jgi:hypothetical protein